MALVLLPITQVFETTASIFRNTSILTFVSSTAYPQQRIYTGPLGTNNCVIEFKDFSGTTNTLGQLFDYPTASFGIVPVSDFMEFNETVNVCGGSLGTTPPYGSADPTAEVTMWMWNAGLGTSQNPTGAAKGEQTWFIEDTLTGEYGTVWVNIAGFTNVTYK